jgi:type I restriction enzyme, S subunit
MENLQPTIREGYKKTDAGIIPEDWEAKRLAKVAKFENGKAHENYIEEYGKYIVINSKFISSEGEVCKFSNKNLSPRAIDEIAMVMSDIPNGKALAKCFLVPENDKYALNQRICSIRPFEASSKYLFYILNRNKYFLEFDSGTGQTNLRKKEVLECPIALPPTKEEQDAIAEVLSDNAALIASLDQLITKKRNIKQGAMQLLLTGKKRLAGFSGDWKTKSLKETTDCLDNVRVPLNEAQRLKMQGDIPYCGANGILDYVNDYVIDDDIILMAEDGGYFDEYLYRPIAYRMIGKCWVNNHAHILKAKEGTNQSFVFYSLVHKDILRFLASGTRAKLNKSEMYKIEIDIPDNEVEQEAIAQILSDMDAEIESLEKKRDKYKAIKQGMRQELLTGKTRLI